MILLLIGTGDVLKLGTGAGGGGGGGVDKLGRYILLLQFCTCRLNYNEPLHEKA